MGLPLERDRAERQEHTAQSCNRHDNYSPFGSGSPGRRIPEAVLERDYCLAWFLTGLSQSKLRDLLIFKGGTALKRCHFGDYRFSEDLDFTLARKAEFAKIRERLEDQIEVLPQ